MTGVVSTIGISAMPTKSVNPSPIGQRVCRIVVSRHGAAGYKLMRPGSHAQHEPISPPIQAQHAARDPTVERWSMRY